MCQTRANCCFCLPLRKGSLLSCVYTLLMGMVGLAWFIWMLVEGLGHTAAYLEHMLNKSDPPLSERAVQRWIRTSIIWETVTYCLALTVYALWMVSALTAIFGIAMKRRNLLVLWICITWLLLALSVLGIINHFRSIERLDAYKVVSISVFSVTFIGNVFTVNGLTSYFNTNCREMDEIENEADVKEGVEYKKCATDNVP